MIVADTTFLIDFMRGKEAAVTLMEKLENVVMTEINIFELIVGVRKIKRSLKPHLEKVEALISTMPVLPLSRRSTFTAAEIAADLINQGQKIEETDSLIAGTALAHGVAEIVTRNKKHFTRIPKINVIAY